MAEDTTIRVFPDGNDVCALIGPNLMEGTAGFGRDASSALRALADNLTRQKHRGVHASYSFLCSYLLKSEINDPHLDHTPDIHHLQIVAKDLNQAEKIFRVHDEWCVLLKIEAPLEYLGFNYEVSYQEDGGHTMTARRITLGGELTTSWIGTGRRFSRIFEVFARNLRWFLHRVAISGLYLLVIYNTPSLRLRLLALGMCWYLILRGSED